MALFLPGLFIIGLALITLLAPKLILGVIAGVLLWLGILALGFAYKVFQMKRSFDQAIKQSQGTNGFRIDMNDFQRYGDRFVRNSSSGSRGFFWSARFGSHPEERQSTSLEKSSKEKKTETIEVLGKDDSEPKVRIVYH
ncbi:MAG: hypothetical protein KDD60_00975 [Bdellovibrionales bacterium]|nr:hypothetical protein [Bdellovibrionales bacterium]